MDFTREPIVETIITPRDGYKIVVRSSKNHGQAEFVVDAIEVVSFGSTCFFRSLERPKVFIVPASDYEILETREPRLAIKAAPLEGVIKTPTRPVSKELERREPPSHAREQIPDTEPLVVEQQVEENEPSQPSMDNRQEKRKDRKKNLRRRRSGREEGPEEKGAESSKSVGVSEERPVVSTEVETVHPIPPHKETVSVPVMTSILPPPVTLIRDDLKRLREDDQYKGAFFMTDEESSPVDEGDDDDAPIVPLSLGGDDEVPRRVEEDVPEVVQQEENTYKATPAPLEEEPFWGVRPVKVAPPKTTSSSESTPSST